MKSTRWIYNKKKRIYNKKQYNKNKKTLIEINCRKPIINTQVEQQYPNLKHIALSITHEKSKE